MDGLLWINRQGSPLPEWGGCSSVCARQKVLVMWAPLTPLPRVFYPSRWARRPSRFPMWIPILRNMNSSLLLAKSEIREILKGKSLRTRKFGPLPAALELALASFRGQITQIPPIYSALRINGERAYTLARQGIIPQMKSRQVTIYELELLEASLPHVAHLRVVCSSGTYVRTLGKDLAMSLGTLGYLTALRRTKVGKFTLLPSFSLDKLQEAGQYYICKFVCFAD